MTVTILTPTYSAIMVTMVRVICLQQFNNGVVHPYSHNADSYSYNTDTLTHNTDSSSYNTVNGNPYGDQHSHQNGVKDVSAPTQTVDSSTSNKGVSIELNGIISDDSDDDCRIVCLD